MTTTHYVRQFHRKHGFVLGRHLPTDADPDVSTLMEGASETLKELSVLLKFKHESMELGKDGDQRLMRAHLYTEEVSEMLHALAVRDEAAVCDAAGDIDFVNVGTVETYDLLPIRSIQVEVGRCNMSRVGDRSKDPRNKGIMRRPDFIGLLKQWRARRAVR